jgi:hypothetical protein
MPNLPVLGNGPVDFTTSTGGIQRSIPLAALYFDTTGQIHAEQWPEWTALDTPTQNAVNGWLKYLVQQSLLVAGAAHLPVPAILIQAAEPGSSGNNISVEIDSVTPETPVENTTANVTVTETDTYLGLTLGTVGNVIGASAGGGTQPGLIFLASTGTPAEVPAAGSGGPLTETSPGSKIFQFDFKNNFVVQAKTESEDGGFTSVLITNVQPDGTFTLTATWKKPGAPTPVALKDLASTFQYELAISAPSGGFAVPAAGTVTLIGGSDAVGAVAAQGTILSA